MDKHLLGMAVVDCTRLGLPVGFATAGIVPVKAAPVGTVPAGAVCEPVSLVEALGLQHMYHYPTEL